MIDPLITCPHCGGVFQPDPEQVDLAAVEVLAMKLHAQANASLSWQGTCVRSYWRKVARKLLVEAAEERLEPEDDD